MTYKKIDETFWTKPEIKKHLSPMEKLLALYMITNPHSHYSGIYYLPVTTMADETGIPAKAIKEFFKNNERFVLYDDFHEVVWVKNMTRHQLPQGNSGNLVKGIASHLYSLHNCPLIGQFLRYYKELSIPFEWDGKEMDNPSGRVDKPMPESVAVAVAVAEEIPPKAPQGGEVVVDSRFESFWEAYPKRVAKEAARKAWRRLKPNDEMLGEILLAIKAAEKTDQWRREGGQFIPHPATWLNQGRWQDDHRIHSPPGCNGGVGVGEFTKAAMNKAEGP